MRKRKQKSNCLDAASRVTVYNLWYKCVSMEIDNHNRWIGTDELHPAGKDVGQEPVSLVRRDSKPKALLISGLRKGRPSKRRR